MHQYVCQIGLYYIVHSRSPDPLFTWHRSLAFRINRPKPCERMVARTLQYTHELFFKINNRIRRLRSRAIYIRQYLK